MSLLKYCKLKEKLPKPDGPLSHYIPSLSVLAVNEELSKVTSSENGDNTKANAVGAGKRRAYSKFSSQDSEYAAEHGVTAVVRHFYIKYPNLKESSVRTWRNTYTAELAQKWKMRDDDMNIEELPEKEGATTCTR